MAEIKFTKRSLDEIESIADYISRDSERFAKITVQKILERTKLLEANPFIGRIVPEVNREEYREIFYGNFRIIYHYEKDVVHILSIHHSARDLSKRGILPEE
jgi:toxin ParE1/3/4